MRAAKSQTEPKGTSTAAQQQNIIHSMNQIIVISIVLAAVCVLARPGNNNPYAAINSAVDISGQPVREKRASYPNDYYICYPSSVVYGYHGLPNTLESHRRSGESEGPSFAASYANSFEARKDRADRERAAYTDSFGK